MSESEQQKPNEEKDLGRKVASGAIGGAVGGLVGSLAGFAVAGPMGAVGGSILGNSVGNASAPLIELAFHRVSADFVQRQLSHREEGRIVTVLDQVVKKIETNFSSGLSVRDDGFFTDDKHDRSSADEIFEGVVLASQREYQEKKILFLGLTQLGMNQAWFRPDPTSNCVSPVFYGNLLANIAFHPEISRAQANLLIRLAEQLSYRQLCLLNLFAKNIPYT